MSDRSLVCPVCGPESGSASERGPLAPYRRCTRCGLRFTPGMREPGAAFYASSPIYAGRDERTIARPEPSWAHEVALDRAPPGSRVFDVGCGDGAFLALAQQRGHRGFGVDHDARAIDAARSLRGLHGVLAGRVPEDLARVAGAPFELVTAFDVIEHLGDPVAVLRALRDVVAAAGRVLVTVPHAERRPAWFDPRVDAPPHHLTLWTAAALRAAFLRAGYAEPEIMEKPLAFEDLRLHLVWRRHGPNPPVPRAGLRERFDSLRARVLLVLSRASGRARGQMLVAVARPQ